MNREIQRFLDEKVLRRNSIEAYRYDLQQFLQVCEFSITESKLGIYQAFLQGLKPSVQRRKKSIVNQFLYFLYEQNQLDHFYKLPSVSARKSLPSQMEVEDLTPLMQETTYKEGQLIALLIAHMGLLPSELANLQTRDIQRDFQIVTVEREGQKRVLPLSPVLFSVLPEETEKVYVFDKNGTSYSRQWFFNRLSEFTTSIDHRSWTAQKLREQYILHQLQEGQTLEEIAKHLGLKSLTSLEKYRRYGY